MRRPDPSEYFAYYETYIRLVPETDILAALEEERAKTFAFLHAIPEDEAGRLHLHYTWTFRQVVGHLLDAERVFAYRALRFARKDEKPLQGFDENAYVEAGEFDRCRLHDLADEFDLTRRSHLLLLKHLPPEAWDRQGLANGYPFTVRALAYCLVGHERHHMAIVRQRLASVA